jgi:glycosyltransferase involved in cell wall biosynthesis
VAKFYGMADAMTVTTDYLAKRVSRFNKRVVVLPNSLDFALLDYIHTLSDDKLYKHTQYLTKGQDKIPLEKAQSILKDKIVIGWGGSPTHLKDLDQATSALKQICSENKDVVLVMMACTTDTLMKCLSDEQWYLVQPVPVFKYHQVLSTMNWDMGICPIEDSVFNKSKSNLKFLEFSSNRYPCVCSNVENYANTVVGGVTGFLADNTPESWYEKLNALIKNEELRKDMGNKAHDFVKDNYNIKGNIDKWLNTYTGLLKD